MASQSHCSEAIHFFKIILKTALGRLRIPNKFTRRYGGNLPKPVFLKPPDGKEWKVYWTKHDGEVWFEKGWKEFTNFYSLDNGHFVLFKYEGTSRFDIHIFDHSALEIDYPSQDTSDNEKDNLDKLSDDSVEILDEMPPNQKARPKSPSLSPRPHKKMRTGTNEDVGRSSNLQNLHVDDTTKGGHSQGTEFQRSINAELKLSKHEMEEEMGGSSFTNKCPNSEHKTRMKSLTAMDKIKALKKASTFRCQNPFFKIVMQPSYVNNRYHCSIPTKFAEKYLKKKRGVMLLQALDGRTWCVKYKFTQIGDGWKKFAMDNHLKVGDVCVFEMIGLSFKVSIFRDAEEQSFSPSKGNLKLDAFRQMHISEKNTALTKAISFKSQNPNFMIEMQQSYIHSKANLHVPTKFAKTYLHLKNNTGLVKFQIQDRVWSVGYVFRRSCKRHKAEFSCGWNQFREDNNLKVGDVCVFELIQRMIVTFQVTIFRATKHPDYSKYPGGRPIQRTSSLFRPGKPRALEEACDATWETFDTIHSRFPDFHLEDEVKLWAAGNDKPPIRFTYARRKNKQGQGVILSPAYK